jgi:hypothetical protein
MPLEEAANGLPMPEVTVPGADSAEYVLGVAGADLATETPRGLTSLPDAVSALVSWPGEAERLRRAGGSVWRVARTDWSLHLRPVGPVATAPVRVFLTRQEAEVVDGRRWLHQAVFWLRHEANTDLYVALPGDAVVTSASVDGAEVTLLQPGPRRLWLPLPGRAGVRRVRLRWLYDPEPDSLERPNLERPRIEGATDGPAVWTVHVPAGYFPDKDGGLAAGAARAAALDLHRAAAQTEVGAALAEMAREGGTVETAALAASQRRFYVLCRRAECALEHGDHGETGPDNQNLTEWLQALYEKNRRLALARGYEAARAEAERQVRGGASFPDAPTPTDNSSRPSNNSRPRTTADEVLPERGTPFHAAVAPEGPAPRLELATAYGRRFRVALTESELLLSLLLAVTCLARFPVAVRVARHFWPEQMLLLGGLGWLLAGPTIVVLFLLLLGICGRFFALVRWARHGFRRPALAPSVAGHLS